MRWCLWLAMFGVLACTIGPIIPPDPWDEFIYGVVWPFVRLNANVALCLLALLVLAALIIGLFGDLSARERRVCGALPLCFGAATFIAVVFVTRDARWWAFRSEAQTTLLALGFTLGTLGLLVVERRLFIADER